MFKNFKNLGQVMLDVFTSNPSITEEQKQKIAEAAEAEIKALVPPVVPGDGKGAAEGEAEKTTAEGGETLESLRTALAAATTEKDSLTAQLKTAKEEAEKYKADAGEYAKIKSEYQVLSDWHKNVQNSIGGVVTPDGNSGEGKTAGGLSEKTLAAQAERERLAKEYPDLMKDLE